eukprot:scaffold114266_cov55-Phaeocystis_antarctica.AAC.3
MPGVSYGSEGKLQPQASSIDRSYRQKQQRAPHAACNRRGHTIRMARCELSRRLVPMKGSR